MTVMPSLTPTPNTRHSVIATSLHAELVTTACILIVELSTLSERFNRFSRLIIEMVDI